MECISEDDLLELAEGSRPLGEAPAAEAHLADCPACSALLCALIATPAGDRAVPDRVGRSLGPYRLDGLIGAGGMGQVYRGHDLRLGRAVAVKLLSTRLAESPELVRRLEAEGRAAAAITHPNVVAVYDTGTDDGVPFIVSELITGESLRSVIDRGETTRATALELAGQLARGVAAAHAQGVVHRDLKPENLIVTGDGTLKILDFGLAKIDGGDDADATVPGTVVGTSGYLAPEQARGEPADPRSDVFAIGAIAYELLTGRRAFAGATFAERLSAVLRDTPDPFPDPAAPIVMRCLDKDPRRRFQSATDLAWALDAHGRGEASPDPAPAPARRAVSRRTFVLGATAAGLGGLALGRLLAPSPRPPFSPEYRQQTFRQGRVASARFTRDGGTLLYAAAWEDLPTTIYSARLGGGGTRPLELPPAQLLAVSSRGELALSLDHRYIEGFHQRGQLALAPLEGGQPRRLGVDVQDADFTPDGAELAIVRRVGGRFRLELPMGRVLLEAGWLSRPRVSPDGRAIACLIHDGPDDDAGRVVVVTRATGAVRTVAADWSSVDGVAWAAGGGALWISASRDGGNNTVWALALDGRVLEQIPSAGRLRVHDLVPHGQRLAVTHVSGRLRTMVKAPGASHEVDLGLSDVSRVGDISRDGHAVVSAAFGDVDIASGAYLSPTGGGPAQRLGDGTPFDLADDGRGVLAALPGPRAMLAVYPVPAGQHRPIAVPGLELVVWARWCAGDAIVLGGRASGRPDRVWRLDPDHGLTPLTDEGVVGAGAVSPDGRTVAVVHVDRLLAIAIDGQSPPVVVPGELADESVCGWSGGEVVVWSQTAPVQVRRVNVATGASTPLFAITPPPVGRRGVYTVTVSDDAGAYAYSYGEELSRLYTLTTTVL